MPASTSAPSERFLHTVFERAEQFFQNRPQTSHVYRFGDLGTITCHYGSVTLAERLSRACVHLPQSITGTAEKSLEFFCLDAATAGFELPAWPWRTEELGPQGVITPLYDHDQKAVWQFGSDVLYLFDRTRNRALFWTHDAASLPYWELSFPLRYPVTWGFEESDALLVHAGAVGNATGAVLLVGKSGSGKSTTSLSCLREGMDFLGDDYVLVDTARPPRVLSLFSSAKAAPEVLATLGRDRPLQSYPLGAGEAETKEVAFLDQTNDPRLVPERPLKALLKPVVARAASPALHPISAATMLRECAPSTLFQLPCDRPRAFRKLHHLAAQLPSFRFELSDDLSANARFLDQWLKEFHPRHV